jgi:glycine betaine transporter
VKNHKTSMNSLRKNVFYPPIILIFCTILFSQINNELFSSSISKLNTLILENVGFLFSWSSFFFLVLLLITYFSPIANVKIGGKNAVPILSKSRWFAVSTCTTIATGILFWGCAEPLFHYAKPPISSMSPVSSQSMNFSMSTMFMHWSFTPYAIYCVAGLVFALSFYNLKRKFSVASLFPFKQGGTNKTLESVIDVICLYSLILGMSASLGAGIYSIIGGLNEIFDIPKSNFVIGCVGAVIIVSFILSAISGLQKGIKWLSTINIIGFILLAIFIFLVSYPLDILKIAFSGMVEYIGTFPQRSLNIGSGISQTWRYDWSIFYWANWFAWAPIAALFLGKISKGYTVRQYINFNLILPALFAIVWISIFSGATLHANFISENLLFETMQLKGEESVMYGLLYKIGYSKITIPITLVLIYISYVTAADSNISAMSAMSEKEKTNSTQEASIITKIIWGLVIGGLTYIMLSTKGLDGIRILSLFGGFPALFIIIFASISLIRFLFNKKLIMLEE